jgi:hypothetical protein
MSKANVFSSTQKFYRLLARETQKFCVSSENHPRLRLHRRHRQSLHRSDRLMKIGANVSSCAAWKFMPSSGGFDSQNE